MRVVCRAHASLTRAGAARRRRLGWLDGVQCTLIVAGVSKAHDGVTAAHDRRQRPHQPVRAVLQLAGMTHIPCRPKSNSIDDGPKPPVVSTERRPSLPDAAGISASLHAPAADVLRKLSAPGPTAALPAASAVRDGRRSVDVSSPGQERRKPPPPPPPKPFKPN